MGKQKKITEGEILSSTFDFDNAVQKSNAFADNALYTRTPPSIEIVQGTAFNDYLQARTESSTVLFYGYGGDDFIIAGNKNESYYGGEGNDWVFFGYNSGPAIVDLQAGIRSNWNTNVTFNSIENLYGTSFNDRFIGNNVDNAFLGEGGDDFLQGGGGADYLNGGGGFDTASYADATSGVYVYLNSEYAYAGAYKDTLHGIEAIIGSSYRDRIYGNNVANLLVGGSGDDTIYGGGGDDTIAGGSGYNRLDGEAGNNTISYADASASLYLNLRLGISFNYSGTDDDIFNFKNAIGTKYGDLLIGDDQDNIFYGGGGGDKFIGGGGNNKFYGEDGIDTVSYENQNAGVDVHLLSGSGLHSDYHNEDLLVGIENVVGTQYSDVISGDDQDNRLDGLSGQDYLYGFEGNDTLNASTADGVGDFLAGGIGDDQLFAGNTTSYLEGNAGNDTLYGSSESDYIFGFGYEDRDSDPNDTDDDSIHGGAGDDTIEGGNGNDEIRGEDGYDMVDGGRGNDTIYLDGGEFTGGGGVDTFVVELSEAKNIVLDFQVGVGGDKLDIYDLLSRIPDDETGPLSEYLSFSDSEAGSVLYFSETSGGEKVAVAIFQDQHDLSLNTLIQNDQIVT